MKTEWPIPEIKIETPALLIIARPAVGRVMVVLKVMEQAHFVSVDEFCAICDRITKKPQPTI